MKCGVVYKFKPHNKINGTLFYCFEHFQFLRKFVDAKFYIVGINNKDLELILKVFREKYKTNFEHIVVTKITDLYKIKLDRTIILDIMSFYDCKEFLTGEVHCYSNESHPMFRYKNDRVVTYYGSYDYQNYDVFSYLKLNFEIFKPFGGQPGVFISSPDHNYIKNNLQKYKEKFQKPIILKKHHSGNGNIFEMIDSVHYIHTSQDRDNRIIPESFYYDKKITIEDLYPIVDSVNLRYKDCLENGLINYTLNEQDKMIEACLK